MLALCFSMFTQSITLQDQLWQEKDDCKLLQWMSKGKNGRQLDVHQTFLGCPKSSASVPLDVHLVRLGHPRVLPSIDWTSINGSLDVQLGIGWAFIDHFL